MTKRLKPEIMEYLSEKLGKKPQDIRPRISEIRQKHSGLTINAAAQMYARQQGTSILAKLEDEDRQSLASVQSITQVSSSKTIKIDKRTLTINSPVHNLSFGDRNVISQEAIAIDDKLARLMAAVDKSKELSGDEKADYKSDIQTVAAQVGKRSPIKSIIKTAWKGLEGLSTLEGCAPLIGQIAPLIHHFIK